MELLFFGIMIVIALLMLAAQWFVLFLPFLLAIWNFLPRLSLRRKLSDAVIVEQLRDEGQIVHVRDDGFYPHSSPPIPWCEKCVEDRLIRPDGSPRLYLVT